MNHYPIPPAHRLEGRGVPYQSADRLVYGYPAYPTNPFQTQRSDAWSLSDYFTALIAHKVVVTALVLFGIAFGYAATKLQTKTYRATGSVQFQEINDNLLNKRDVEATGPSEGDSYVETQMRLLQSEALLEHVAGRMGLPQRAVLKDKPGLLEKQKTVLGPRASLEDWALLMKKNLKVTSPDKTSLVEVSFDFPNAAFAAEFIGTLVNEFSDENLRSRSEASRFTAKWLSSSGTSRFSCHLWSCRS